MVRRGARFILAVFAVLAFLSLPLVISFGPAGMNTMMSLTAKEILGPDVKLIRGQGRGSPRGRCG
jgi:hypothetical protein